MRIDWKILYDDILQLTQLDIYLVMMLRKSLHIIVGLRFSLKERFDVWKDILFLILHMMDDTAGILIIYFDDERRQIVGGVKRCYKFLPNERQLKVQIVFVRGFKILHQGGHGKTRDTIRSQVSIDGIIDNTQKSEAIDSLIYTDLFYRLVAKSQVDAKRAKAAQNRIIIL